MQLALSKNVQREYQHFPEREKAKIKRKLLALEKDPYSGKKLGGELSGFYSLKVWPHRILYEINKEKNRIEVHKIRHRQGAYK